MRSTPIDFADDSATLAKQLQRILDAHPMAPYVLVDVQFYRNELVSIVRLLEHASNVEK